MTSSSKQTLILRRQIISWTCGILVLGSSGIRAADSWEAAIHSMLSEFLSCKSPIDDLSPCNIFLGRALKRVFNIDDFNDASHAGAFLSANQIATYVSVDAKWTALGAASTQEALNESQGYANVRKAVVAVYKGSDHGHVCMILPGTLTNSSSWGMKVPNSASFFLNDPQSSYVGGPLSRAFGPEKKSQVLLYGRNY